MWLSNDCTCVCLCVLYAIYIWKSAFHLWYLLSRIATMFTILQLHLLHKPKRELETNRVKCTHFVLLKYWNKITNGLRKVSVLGGEAVVAAYTRGLLCIISCASFFRLCHIVPFHRTTCTVAKDILNFWWQQIYKHNISLFHVGFNSRSKYFVYYHELKITWYCCCCFFSIFCTPLYLCLLSFSLSRGIISMWIARTSCIISLKNN